MKPNKMALGIMVLTLTIMGCKKDDDSSFEDIVGPSNEIVGSLWLNSGNAFRELDLKDTQEINAFTTKDSYRCTEFNGVFICTEGDFSGTQKVMKKGTFNGELAWSKDYDKGAEQYYELSPGIVHKNNVVLSYKIVNTTTYNTTYYIESLNLDNGNMNWSIAVDNEVRNIKTYKDQVIAELSVGSSTIELLSIDGANGTIDNRIPFTDRIGKLMGGTSSIIAMTWNNEVISMDEQLNVNWTFETQGPNILGGYEVGNNFIFYSRDETVYNIDVGTGNLIWKHAYLGIYPLAINSEDNKVYISHRIEGESNIQVRTLDLFSGEEMDSYTYMTNNDLNPSSTKFYFFDQHLYCST